MNRSELVDFFSCAGGAARGYQRAGFRVTCVDIAPQPRCVGDVFIQGDAMELMADRGFMARFDAAHASPPCQSESDLRHRTGVDYVDLLTPTLELLRAQSLPWVVENVAGTVKMPGSLVLCGTEFGLRSGDRWLRRHRRFLASFPLWGAGGCSCRSRRVGGVYGTGGGGQMTRGFKLTGDRAKEAMGIDWMTQAELSQAIPPVYTEHLGSQLRDHLSASVGAA